MLYRLALTLTEKKTSLTTVSVLCLPSSSFRPSVPKSKSEQKYRTHVRDSM